MSNKVQLIAHDFSTMHHTGYARFGKIKIGNRVFIGANSTILMNVHIGNDVIIGAGSLVNKDVPDGMVVAGVPARVICSTEEFRTKQLELIHSNPNFLRSDTSYGGEMTPNKRNEIIAALEKSPNRVFYAKFRDFYKKIGTGHNVQIQ